MSDTTTNSSIIADRKLHELSRETVDTVTALIPSFCEKTEAAHAKTRGDGWYAAMQSAVGHGPPFNGEGGSPLTPFGQVTQVLNAQGFYRDNIAESWKELTAHQLNVDPTSPEVYDAWKVAVTNGSSIPVEMLEGKGTSRICYAFSWWSPAERMMIPSSASTAQGNQDFFTMSRVVSLAPEWYPEGLVRVTIDVATTGSIRPSSYDGMTSPLWVQHPPDQNAATGGEARETLNPTELLLEDLVTVDQIASCQAYVVSRELGLALANSPSVNDYSVDLNEVSLDPVLGGQQTTIVEQVRNARARANESFGDAPMSDETEGLLTKIETVSSLESVASDDGEIDWKVAMETAAHEHHVAHRGHRYPYEHFQEQLERSPEYRPAILGAATELIRESEDPAVLNLAASLGRGSDDADFYDALVERLEGAVAVPEASGTRSASIKSDMLDRLRDKFVATHPELGPRAHAVLAHEGRPDIRLAMLHHHDPDGQKLEVLKEAVDDLGESLDSNLVATTGAKLADSEPEHVEEAARCIADLPDKHRAAFHDHTKHTDSGDEVARILNIATEDS